MKKLYYFLIILFLLIVSSVYFFYQNYKIKGYTETYDSTLYSNGVNWIQNNIPEDSNFLTWYDDSALVYYFGNRNVVVLTPSREYAEKYILNYNPKKIGDFSDSEKFRDVVIAYSTLNINQTREVMKKYDTDYIFLTKKIYILGGIISNFSGIQIIDCKINDSRGYKREIAEIGKDDCFYSLNISYYKFKYYSEGVDSVNGTIVKKNFCDLSYNLDYCEKYIDGNGIYSYNYSDMSDYNNWGVCLNENSTMYRMLKLQIIDGFEKVYSDDNLVIYKLEK